MTEQELYRCESHERRVSSLEERVHIQDKATEVLSNDLKTLSRNVERITNMVECATKKIDEIIPKLEISNAYRTGIMFVIAIVGSKIFEIIITKIFK